MWCRDVATDRRVFGHEIIGTRLSVGGARGSIMANASVADSAAGTAASRTVARQSDGSALTEQSRTRREGRSVSRCVAPCRAAPVPQFRGDGDSHRRGDTASGR